MQRSGSRSKKVFNGDKPWLRNEDPDILEDMNKLKKLNDTLEKEQSLLQLENQKLNSSFKEISQKLKEESEARLMHEEKCIEFEEQYKHTSQPLKEA